jgi:glycolate oxidase FAD binding subunit
MKNVAGFDVARLMTGAMGTLGLITEISLKCLPLPKVEMTLAFECSADEAIRATNEWSREPLPVSATCFHRGELRVRLRCPPRGGRGGGQARRAKGCRRGTVLGGLRDQTHLFFAQPRADGVPLWRLSVKSTAPYTDLRAAHRVGGALRWLASGERTDPRKVRGQAGSGGHDTLPRAGQVHRRVPAARRGCRHCTSA